MERARSRRHPVRTAREPGAGGGALEIDAARDSRRPAHPPLRRGPCRDLGGAQVTPTSVHVRPDPRFVRDGNDVVSTVDLTMHRKPRSERRPQCRPWTARWKLEFKPGHQPGEIRVLRGKGMPVLRVRARRPSPARERRECRAT
jgi:hypothetical protein